MINLYTYRKFPHIFSTIIDSLDNNYLIELIKLLDDDNKNHKTMLIDIIEK